jgi:hypothetical protein
MIAGARLVMTCPGSLFLVPGRCIKQAGASRYRGHLGGRRIRTREITGKKLVTISMAAVAGDYMYQYRYLAWDHFCAT